MKNTKINQLKCSTDLLKFSIIDHAITIHLPKKFIYPKQVGSLSTNEPTYLGQLQQFSTQLIVIGSDYRADHQDEVGIRRFSQLSCITYHLYICNTIGTGSFLFHSGKYVARPYRNINFSPLQHHSIQKCYLLQTSYYTTKVLRDNHP